MTAPVAPRARKRKPLWSPPPIPVWEHPNLGTTADGFFAHGYRYGSEKPSRPIPPECFPARTTEQRLFVHGLVAATQDRLRIVNGEPGARFDTEVAWLRLLAERKAEAKRQREAKAAAEAAAAAPTFAQMVRGRVAR